MTGDGVPITEGLVQVPELGNEFGTENAWKLTMKKPGTLHITLIIEAKGISVDSHESSLWDGVTLDATGNSILFRYL